jgi:hypothetical protein
VIYLLPCIRVELNFDFISLVDGLFRPKNLRLLFTTLFLVLVLHLVLKSADCSQQQQHHVAGHVIITKHLVGHFERSHTGPPQKRSLPLAAVWQLAEERKHKTHVGKGDAQSFLWISVNCL